jgi:hypothetical protein
LGGTTDEDYQGNLLWCSEWLLGGSTCLNPPLHPQLITQQIRDSVTNKTSLTLDKFVYDALQRFRPRSAGHRIESAVTARIAILVRDLTFALSEI